MTAKKQRQIQRGSLEQPDSFTLDVPPGTDTLPIVERLHVYLTVFESGCSCILPIGKPEDCPKCTRALVDAVRKAVDEEISSDPMGAFERMARAVTGHCPACDGEADQHKDGCEPFIFGSDARIYNPPAQKMPKCPECGGRGRTHIPGCPNSFKD